MNPYGRGWASGGYLGDAGHPTLAQTSAMTANAEPAPSTPGMPPGGAAAGPIPPDMPVAQPGPPAVLPPEIAHASAGRYVTPEAHTQAIYEHGGSQAQAQHAANAYIHGRLQSLHRVAAGVNDPVLTSILNSGGNPHQVWAAASRRWTELATQAGYQDPRVYLQRLLAASQRPGGAYRGLPALQ